MASLNEELSALSDDAKEAGERMADYHRIRHNEVLDMSIQELLGELLLLLEGNGVNVNVVMEDRWTESH
jgi:hypothetical protein